MIRVTEIERRIFDTCTAVVAHFNLGTTVRVVGGWVRDKLLGNDSNDIDIALDNVTGVQFAHHLNEYLEKIGVRAHAVGVIQANPKKSKHLETATCTLFGKRIDINNLRAENYTHNHSRIPAEVRIGTPLEDAQRRDLTINALFYNINNDSIEDFCGMGLADLKEGIVRTPCDPMQTFTDDPLRVLRAARFAGRFGYSIAENLVQAARSDTIKNNLLNKVSRERVGKEIKEMLETASNPVACFRILCITFDMYDVVFQIPPSYKQDAVLRDSSLNIMERTHSILSHLHDRDRRTVLLMAAFFAPLWDRDAHIVQFIIEKSLKLHKLAKDVTNMLRAAHEFARVSQEWIANSDPPDALKLVVGHTIRIGGECWKDALLLSGVIASPSDSMRDWIGASGVENCWAAKPHFDGNFLASQFHLRGREIGNCAEKIVDWMILHPHGTKEECLLYLEMIHNNKSS